MGLMQNYNDWLVNENQFFQGKTLFLVTGVAALTESLWQAGISPSGYLGYINMHLLSVLISFSFFSLLYCPPLTWYDYYKCGYDKNRHSINLDAVNKVSLT